MLAIIFQQFESVFPQQADGDKVAEGHQPHGDVGKAPGEVEGGERPEHDHAAHQQAVNIQYPFPAGEVVYVGFAVVVVSDDAAEGEEEEGDCHKDAACRAYLIGQRALGQLHAVGRTVQWRAAEKDDESGAGADNQGIGEDAQCLNQPLLDGVADVCRCCHVGGGTHAGFVAEQSALNALHQCHADAAAQCLFPTEGMADNQRDDRWKFLDVQQDDGECQEDVAQCHDGNKDAAHFGDALHAAEDDNQGTHGDDAAHRGVVESESPLEGCAKSVALHGVEGETESDGDKYGEQRAHPRLFQPFAHIVGGTAYVGVLALYLI